MDMKPQTVEMQEWLGDVLDRLEPRQAWTTVLVGCVAFWVIVGIILWVGGAFN